jgi:acyl-CoA synthetase (NDP forming)
VVGDPAVDGKDGGRGPCDVSGRTLARRAVDLDRFFSPRTVAVVGASDTEGRPTTGMWRKIQAWAAAHGADLRPVNPHRPTVDGLACAPTVAALGLPPGALDLVAILTGDVEKPLREAIEADAAFAVIFAAGFAESGPAGAAREAELRTVIESGRTRVLGPNTNLNAFELFDDRPGPALALVTQSGHQGRPLFQAQALGVAVSHWAPTGNEADLEVADFVGWFAERAGVGAIAAYVEGFKDGRTLQLALDRCVATDTPLIAVKVGRSPEGRAMARSHTGHLTGSDRVVDGVFRQYGVTRVDGLDELQEVATLLARLPAPTAPGVCIYGISGGSGAHLADLCGAAGIRLPRLGRDTLATLRECIPDYLRIDNPVDCGGAPVMDDRGRRIIDALLVDPRVGALVCPITGALPALSEPLARDLVAAAGATDKPVVVIWGSPVSDDPALTEVLLPSSIPVFRSFPNCVRGLRAWFDWHGLRRGWRSPFRAVPRRLAPGASPAGTLLDEAGTDPLAEPSAKALLAAYGIAVTRDRVTRSPSETAAAVAALRGPAVLKVISPDLLHRTELGLVRTGVTGATAARRVHRELVERAEQTAPEARIDGVLVSEQLDGVEVHVGLVHDELFGPAVSVGWGGLLVEAIDDVAVRVPPFGRAEARRMIAETRVARVLAGVRGRPPAAVDALVDLLLGVQRVGLDLGDRIAEMDINPVIVTADRAVAADALVVPRWPR